MRSSGTRWRHALGLGLSLLGCSRGPAFPVTWELGAHASVRGADVAARERSARSRRTEVVKTPEATLTFVIDSAEVEVGSDRGQAPVRVELSPTGVATGLRLTIVRVGPLEVSGSPPQFFQRVELATVDAKGDETARFQLATTASGPPSVAPLRPFGK
jgi:hypothetical protein